MAGIVHPHVKPHVQPHVQLLLGGPLFAKPGRRPLPNGSGPGRSGRSKTLRFVRLRGPAAPPPPTLPGMKAADFNPHKLDVAAFAKAGASLSGQCPLTDLPRLLESVPEEARADLLHPLSWAVTGLLRPVAGGEPEVWLHLRAHADVPLSCQRCLQPMVEHLAIERQARFVADEATAAELDAVLAEGDFSE